MGAEGKMPVPAPFRVLNAGGSTNLREARSQILRAAGFEVREARDDAQMLHELTAERPDLIIVANLPEGAGIPLCRRLKDDPATAAIPIISISEAPEDARQAARVLDGGAEAFSIEPVHPESLVATVRALLRFARVERFSAALNRVNTAINSTLDFEQIMRRVVVEATREIGADSAGVMTLEQNEWVIKYTFDLPQIVGMRLPDRPEVPGSISAQARADKPFVVMDDSLFPAELRETLQRHSVSTKLFVPLRVRGQLVGLIAFHYHSPREFDPLQVDFAARLGSAVSLALENARLYSEAEEGRKLLDALMQHIPHGIAIADAPGGELRMVSSHGREMTGLGREVHGSILGEAKWQRWRLLRPGTNAPAQPSELPLIRAIRDGSAVTSEEWILETPRGERIPILLDAGPIRGADGGITGGVVAWQDISARKRLEQELLRARQMEAVGFLAGGVAHEFNNMLTVISGHCQLLLEATRSASVRERLRPVLEAAHRLTSLTSELLGLAGRQMIQPALVCLNATIQRMRDALQELVGSSYVLKTELEPSLGKVHADLGQVEHLIVSLVLHARDSMPQGGTIEITTGNVEVSSPETARCCQVPPGRYALLSVSDTGPGLDPETAEHLFEPFLGGKVIGKGAGLGLSAIYGVVKQNRGDIRVTSQPGKGTRFQVCLPQIAASLV